MALHCHATEIKSKCVTWDTELPRPKERRKSPKFSMEDCNWLFHVSCCWEKEEKWMIELTRDGDGHLGRTTKIVVPYGKRGEIYYRLASSIDTWFHRSEISFYLKKSHISFLFLFVEDSLTHNSNEIINSGEESINTLCLKSLSDDILQLFDKSDSADVSLKCRGKSIPVHKTILAARSEVFSAMFSHDMSEKNTGVVDIVDLDPPILEEFVKYLYSGKVEEMSIHTAIALYQAGDKYAIKSLKQLCASYILQHAYDEIIYEMLPLADKAGDEEFLDGLVNFAARDEKFLKTDDWRDFSLKNSNLAVRVCLKFIHNRH